MNYMEFYRRINRQYNRGLKHGLSGKNRPGLITGRFRQAYKSGRDQGQALRKFKQK